MRANFGFSIIEVLIAIVILSFGLLGVIGLETVSLQRSRAAYYRTEAAVFVNNIVAQASVGDSDCRPWLLLAENILPQAVLKCALSSDSYKISLCWNMHLADEECISASS
ncbi:MAG: prepilin-type N-terminal cleavage/methylation domain-containing protein [Gammaproteobacteria bacterium]|nr:prepilin-type N-terminal cleavage/methylation domain-containing protein [Gammaproteobacteria bacterium]